MNRLYLNCIKTVIVMALAAGVLAVQAPVASAQGYYYSSHREYRVYRVVPHHHYWRHDWADYHRYHHGGYHYVAYPRSTYAGHDKYYTYHGHSYVMDLRTGHRVRLY